MLERIELKGRIITLNLKRAWKFKLTLTHKLIVYIQHPILPIHQ